MPISVKSGPLSYGIFPFTEGSGSANFAITKSSYIMNFSHDWSKKYFKKKKKKKCFENYNTYLFILGFRRGMEGGVVNLFPSIPLMKCVAELL